MLESSLSHPRETSNRLAPFAAILVLLVFGSIAWLALRHPVAPNVPLTTIKGERFDVASLKGKVVVVNFWATSCLYCVQEMPGVVDSYQRFHAQGLDVVAVAMRYDPPSYVVDYAQSRGLPFKVALDISGEAAKRFGDVEATPTTVIIDRSGHVVARYEGELDFEAFNALLEKELAEQGPAAAHA